MAKQNDKQNELDRIGDNLFEALLFLEDADDFRAFFEDLCTIQELQAMAQRWEVAKMLKLGQTYQTIAAKTGVSTATISRVNRSLTYGKNGYSRVLERMEGTEK